MALIRIHEKPNAVPVNASVFVIETKVSGVWYTQKVTWEQLVGLVAALDNLQNYYKKSETYTKQEVQALIAQIPSFTVEVVQQLPTEDISTTTLYLVPKTTPEAQDYYEEYINLDGTTSGWEYVGTTQVDLSNYYTKAETETYVKGDGADYIVNTKTFSTLTTTAKTILAAINEVAGVASSAQTDATQAIADASAAQGTANSASAAASAAQTTADAAATAAGNAASAASAAQTTANAAQTAASAAQTTADAAAAGLLLKEDKTAMPEDVADIIRQMKTPKTVTGNPVTFETVEETFAKGAELTFGPIQDLHGYDSPWPGGAGKNKFHNTANTTTLNGVTFNINSDGTVRATGTATENTYMTIGRFYAESGVTYILNGCPSGGANNKYRMTLVGYGYEYGDGYSFTGDGSYHQVSCDVYPNAGAVDLLFKPMIRLATETDAYFAPYENICAIIGRDIATVTISDGETEETETIEFPSTIYGGTDEVISGSGSSTHKIITFDGTEAWYETTGVWRTNIEDDYKKGNFVNGITNLYPMQAEQTGAAGVQEGHCCLLNSDTLSRVMIRDSSFSTVDEFKAFLSTHNLQVCYELATPSPFNTAPTNILLNAGTNVVSTDADTAAVTYTELTTLDDMRTLINAAQTT